MSWRKRDRVEREEAAKVTNPRVACLSCRHFTPPRHGGQRVRGRCHWWGARRLWWSACSMWEGPGAAVMKERAREWGRLWWAWVDKRRGR